MIIRLQPSEQWNTRILELAREGGFQCLIDYRQNHRAFAIFLGVEMECIYDFVDVITGMLPYDEAAVETEDFLFLPDTVKEEIPPFTEEVRAQFPDHSLFLMDEDFPLPEAFSDSVYTLREKPGEGRTILTVQPKELKAEDEVYGVFSPGTQEKESVRVFLESVNQGRPLEKKLPLWRRLLPW